MNGIGLRDRGPCLLCRRSYPPGAADVSGAGPPPDPCLGLLEDVAQACCGHGIQRPFVLFGPGARPGDSGTAPRLTKLTGVAALTWFGVRGVGPDILDALSAARWERCNEACAHAPEEELRVPDWLHGKPLHFEARSRADVEALAGQTLPVEHRARGARPDLIPPERSEGGTLSTLATPRSRQRNLAHRDDSPALCELSASASLVDGAVEKSVDSGLEREAEGSDAVGRQAVRKVPRRRYLPGPRGDARGREQQGREGVDRS